MKSLKILCLALLVCAATVPVAAQDLQGRWGVGGFVAYNIPMYTFGDRWDGSTDKWGFNLNYVSSSRLTMEVEYHNAKFDNGVLETQPFTWGPTGKDYKSGDINADSAYDMKFNSLLLSGVVHFRKDRSMDGGSYSPYLVVGAVSTITLLRQRTSSGLVRRRATQLQLVVVLTLMAIAFLRLLWLVRKTHAQL